MCLSLTHFTKHNTILVHPSWCKLTVLCLHIAEGKRQISGVFYKGNNLTHGGSTFMTQSPPKACPPYHHFGSQDFNIWILGETQTLSLTEHSCTGEINHQEKTVQLLINFKVYAKTLLLFRQGFGHSFVISFLSLYCYLIEPIYGPRYQFKIRIESQNTFQKKVISLYRHL